MKSTLIIIILFSYTNSFSQVLNCLNFELYNADYDVVQLQNEPDSQNQIYKPRVKARCLQLVVLPNSYSAFPVWTDFRKNGVDRGFKVILKNNSSKDFGLSNMDGKIIIKRQVYFNKDWKYLESYDKSRKPLCGNSFLFEKVIKSGEHFTFVAPCIQGNIKAKFRFVVFTKAPSKRSSVYSNVFDGFLNKELME